MSKQQKKVRFIKEFTSPVLGNVYLDKVATIDAKLADKFIAGGQAEEMDDKAEAKAESQAKAKKPAAESDDENDDKVPLNGSSVQPAELFHKKGNAKKQKIVPLAHVVAEAFEESELDAAAWNALPDADREQHIADTIKRLKLTP